MSWELRGKTVFVTGAARGIGAETARRAAAAGANVALVGLEPEELQRVAGQCGSSAAAFECDVTDWLALERAADGTVERFGGIDIVMANAGISPAGMVRSIDRSAFERTIEINLIGAWRTVRTCLPRVIERRGYVLVTASLAAALHAPGMAAYAASKAGVEAFSNALRSEVKRLGVDVGVAYFSFIDTDMVRGADAHPVLSTLRDDSLGPLSKTYPVSSVGKAVVAGMEKRSRRVVFPGWARILLALRTAIQPLTERSAYDRAAEVDQLFLEDVQRRGAEAASAPIGAGGAAVTEPEHQTAASP
jgi:NAD(P)-dependent dehydrogenase (short-subunit alcohol dehydrogenase family)